MERLITRRGEYITCSYDKRKISGADLIDALSQYFPIFTGSIHVPVKIKGSNINNLNYYMANKMVNISLMNCSDMLEYIYILMRKILSGRKYFSVI